jgi:hypothetical protein
MLDLRHIKQQNEEEKEKLTIDTYDENDPDIQILNEPVREVNIQVDEADIKASEEGTYLSSFKGNEHIIKSEPLEVIHEEQYKMHFDIVKPSFRPSSAKTILPKFTDKRFVYTNILNINFTGTNINSIPEENISTPTDSESTGASSKF